MPNTSGVGISFGADRIYDVMTGLDLFPDDTKGTTRALCILNNIISVFDGRINKKFAVIFVDW